MTEVETYHTVEQGEHLSSIAQKYGFADYHAIWNHQQNAELKKKRQNPNVLFPGDRFFIPDKDQKEFSRSTEQRHNFRIKAQPLMLRVRCERAYGPPIDSSNCELRVESDLFKLVSDAKGQIERSIASTAERAKLTIRDKRIPSDIEVPIHIGHLDPVEERSGQLARLANLGYYRTVGEEVDEREFLSGIEEFQCEHGLTVDGKCGPKTQAKLKEVHGC